MITSRSFEITLRGHDCILFSRTLDALVLPLVVAELFPLRAEESFAIIVRRPEGDRTRLRIRLGNETIAEAAPGAIWCETPLEPWLRNEFGESRVAVERTPELETERFEPLFELGIAISPRPEVAEDFRSLVEEVAAVHEGLARDVLGRSTGGLRPAAGPVSVLDADVQLRRLETLYERFQSVLARIADQPSIVLKRVTRLTHYRGGDRCDTRGVAVAIRDPRTRLDGQGRVASLGKMLVHGVTSTADVPEHRHLADGLPRLAQRADALARHCQHAAELLQMEEDRWGATLAGRPSVFEQRDLPRIQVLGERVAAGRRLGDGFRQLLRQHDYLADAGPPRTLLGPTPAFLGRPAYREAYRLLVEARQVLGVLIDRDVARFTCRSLESLHEYWCFLRTVRHLRDRFGPPESRATFSLVDDIYRPELAPGQEFHFRAGSDVVVTAAYQPEFHPWAEARTRGEIYGASLTRNPLRPDITVSVRRDDRPPVILVLDAKVTDLFTPVKLRDLTDYARQIFELATGRQPVRQVFLLHRDRRALPVSNVPGYLKGRHIDRSAMLIGAVRCVPERTGRTPLWLARVIDRFLEVYAGRTRLAAASTPGENDISAKDSSTAST